MANPHQPGDRFVSDWLFGLTDPYLAKVRVDLGIERNAVRTTSTWEAAEDILQLARQDPEKMWKLEELARQKKTPAQDLKLWAPTPHPLYKNFTGRYDDRRDLTEWLTIRNHPLLFLTGLHGCGKSELAWAWMIRDVMGKPIPDAVKEPGEKTKELAAKDVSLKLIVWWHFSKESSSGFGMFLSDFCARLEKDGLISSIPAKDNERVNVLLEALNSTPMLVVLDEFENETLYRPRPALDIQLDAVEDNELWRCYDPCASRFLLSAAASVGHSRVLVTCPFVPDNLEQLAGCHEQPVGKMTKEDALAYFRAQGVGYGPDSEIDAVCERRHYHARDLRLYSTLFALSAGGHPDLDQVKSPDDAAEQAVFNALSPSARELLKAVSPHPAPFRYSLVRTVWKSSGVEELAETLEELQKWNLLWLEDGSYQMDRRFANYVYHRLVTPHELVLPAPAEQPVEPPSSSAALLNMLRDPEAEPEFRNEDELDPLVNSFVSLANSGSTQEAWDLWKTHLNPHLYYRFGTYHRCLYLLEMLLPLTGTNKIRLGEEDLGWLYNSLANCSSLPGQTERAVKYYREAVLYFERSRKDVGLAMALGNLGDDLIKLGEFDEAHDSLERMLELCRIAAEEHVAAYGYHVRSTLYVIEGRYELATADLEQALGTFSKVQQRRYLGATQALFARLELLRGDAGKALEYAQSALDNARWKENRRDLVRVHWLLGSARLAQFETTGDQTLLEAANQDLCSALSILDQISLVEFQPDVFMSLSELGLHTRSLGKAIEWVGKAANAIQVSAYKLKECELSLLRAKIATAQGDGNRASEYAQKAVDQARFNGGRYVYHSVTERAQRLLARLVQ